MQKEFINKNYQNNIFNKKIAFIQKANLLHEGINQTISHHHLEIKIINPIILTLIQISIKLLYVIIVIYYDIKQLYVDKKTRP